MKNFLRLLVLTISILIVSVPVFANTYDTMLISPNPITSDAAKVDSILVQLNGAVVDFTDSEGNKVEPQIINDRTMVPMRKIFEVFGAEVEWINDTRSIKATTNGLEIGLQIDNPVATVKNASGDTTEITLDSAPVIIEGRTLVPVRFIAESLDKKVGWDAYNRVVIVIDTSIAENMLKQGASNFYEYITTDYKKIESYEALVNIDGKVKYVDEEIKSNNTSLNIAGNMDMKYNKEAILMDLVLNFTGKGTLIEEVKEQSLEKLELSFLLDVENNAMYLKMASLDDKWVKYDLAEDGEIIKTLLEMAYSYEKNGLEAMMDVLLPENKLTVSSYEELQTSIQMIIALMNNENFKVSGRTAKTYTYELDLSELLGFIGEEESEDFKFKMGFEVKIEDGIAKESKCLFEISEVQAEEKADVVIEADAKYKTINEKVTITIPKAEDVIVPYAE